MAKVWPTYEGHPNTVGEPWATLSLDDAIRVLDLEPEHFLLDLSRTLRLGDRERNLTLLGYRLVIVEIGEDEARADWRPGFYRSPLAPAEALFGLQVHQRLGDQWRDEWKKGQDADGEPAMWLWAVLKADTPDAAWGWDNRERIQTEVREIAARSDVPDWVFVRFRKEKDERAVS